MKDINCKSEKLCFWKVGTYIYIHLVFSQYPPPLAVSKKKKNTRDQQSFRYWKRKFWNRTAERSNRTEEWLCFSQCSGFWRCLITMWHFKFLTKDIISLTLGFKPKIYFLTNTQWPRKQQITYSLFKNRPIKNFSESSFSNSLIKTVISFCNMRHKEKPNVLRIFQQASYNRKL